MEIFKQQENTPAPIQVDHQEHHEQPVARQPIQQQPVREQPIEQPVARQEDEPVYMQSMTGWRKRRNAMLEGSEWLMAREQIEVPEEEKYMGNDERPVRIPKQQANAAISKMYREVYGRKVGRLERHKIRKDLEKEQARYQDRVRAVDAYYSSVNQREEEFQDRKYKDLRDPWSYIEVLDNAEDRKNLMDGYANRDPELIRKGLKPVFDVFLNLNLRTFNYRDEDEFCRKFARNYKFVRAGHVLRNAMEVYTKNGGVFRHEDFIRLNAISDMMEEMSKQYTQTEEVQTHPAHFMLKQKDLAKMSDDKLDEMMENISDQMLLYEPRSSEYLRLDSLKKYLVNYKENRKHDTVLLKPGEDALECFERSLKERREKEAARWFVQRDGYQTRKQEIDHVLSPAMIDQLTEEKGLPLEQGHRWSGSRGVETFRASMMELYHLGSTGGATLEKLIGEEGMQGFDHSADSLRYLIAQGDPESLGKALAIIMKGFVNQFIGEYGEENYKQFAGQKASSEAFGRNTAMLEHMIRLSNDLKLLAGKDQEVTQNALDRMTEREKTLLKKGTEYLARVEKLNFATFRIFSLDKSHDAASAKIFAGEKDRTNDESVEVFNDIYLYYSETKKEDEIGAWPDDPAEPVIRFGGKEFDLRDVKQ